MLLTGRLRASIKSSAVIAVVLYAGLSLYGFVIDRTGMLPVSYREAGYPAVHWVMMGLQQPFGFYDADDVKYTESFVTKESRTKADLEIIKQRAKNYGIKGLFTLFTRKNVFVWGDGTYFAPVKLNRNILYMTPLHKYLLPLSGNQNYIFIYFCTAFQLFILISMLISGIYCYKSGTVTMSTVFALTALGAGIFFMVWEDRSRYLINLSPFLLLCSISWFTRFSRRKTA
jgi:hypothetical protein